MNKYYSVINSKSCSPYHKIPLVKINSYPRKIYLNNSHISTSIRNIKNHHVLQLESKLRSIANRVASHSISRYAFVQSIILGPTWVRESSVITAARAMSQHISLIRSSVIWIACTCTCACTCSIR